MQAIKDSKSVDKLLILDGRADPKQKKLVSMTANQWIRFWDLTDSKAPTFKFHCGHPKEDSLSAIAVTKDNNTMVTGDTSGQMKVWDITKVDFNDPEQTTEKYFLEKFFIIAHRSVINTIQIVDDKRIQSDKFIITASNDHNINLHRLSNGVYIGQFGQSKGWNIHDMTPYEKM
jgi:WD40 repeat protein